MWSTDKGPRSEEIRFMLPASVRLANITYNYNNVVQTERHVATIGKSKN